MDSLEVVYNNIVMALNGVSIRVEDHDKVALFGSNGAGKTTLTRSILATLKSRDGEIKKGTIRYQQVVLNSLDAVEIVGMGIALVPEGRKVFVDLTVDENLLMGAYLGKSRRLFKSNYDRVLSYFPPLAKLRNRVAGYLSGGEQQMLAIGRALMANPRLLILDEPSMGLSPIMCQAIFEMLDRLNKEEGTSILLIEQNAALAIKFANYGYVLESGKVVFDGPSEKLLANEDVKEFYLGVTGEHQLQSYRETKSYKRRKRWL